MTEKDCILSPERLRELLHYDPLTGIFTWRISRGGKTLPGTIAGSVKPKGYIAIGVDGYIYQSHRLAWYYMTGEWPRFLIDHRDLDPANNRWENLRDVTTEINCQNQNRAHKGSATGMLGVYPARKGKRFLAMIRVHGKLKQLGSFLTKEEAHAAYLIAKREQHAGCTI